MRLQSKGVNRWVSDDLPHALRGRWCLIVLPGELPRSVLVQLLILSADADVPTARTLLSPVAFVSRSLGHWIVQYVPADADRLQLELLSLDAISANPVLVLLSLPRSTVAALLIGRHPFAILRELARRGPGRQRRMRALLARLATTERLPPTYESWIALFDRWTDAMVAQLAGARSECWPRVLVLVLAASATAEATQSTIASVTRQIGGATVRLVPSGTALREVLPGADEEYVALLQAGEILPHHALAVMREWAARHGHPAGLFADEDRVNLKGTRFDPLFKPEPNRALMLSGTLTRGLWLFRRELVERHQEACSCAWAEAVRLDLWLRLHEAGEAGQTARVPFVLTHRRADAEAAPAEALAKVVRAHLKRIGQAAHINASRVPLRVRPSLPVAYRRKVSLIVPSACRAAHVGTCLKAVLSQTAYPDFELVLVVTQSQPLDAAQQATLRPIRDDPRTHVAILKERRFNYSMANNFGASLTDATFLCLMNDDVAPIGQDWLDIMMGHFADPEVGAVGAMLYYEGDTIQHGGVIIGIGGLADHANRFLPRSEPGYAWRASLNQEVSAVTGACLLVRRAAFEQVSGLDESYPIAFNDVDFCLKLREAGWRIVLAADASLRHYESLSLGHHFSGERATLERIEVQRMRRRWHKVVAADPFHNPNLSLIRGAEWSLAFPPRVRKEDILEPTASLASNEALPTPLDRPSR